MCFFGKPEGRDNFEELCIDKAYQNAFSKTSKKTRRTD
jgi:hypothetical protein